VAAPPITRRRERHPQAAHVSRRATRRRVPQRPRRRDGHRRVRGKEFQVTYNPQNNWTIKFTTPASRRRSFTKIGPEYDAWIKERQALWTTATATGRTPFWSYTGQDFLNGGHHQQRASAATQRVQDWFFTNVDAIARTNKRNEGKNTPGQREWRWNVISNYSFQEGRFKGLGIGGAARWETRPSSASAAPRRTPTASSAPSTSTSLCSMRLGSLRCLGLLQPSAAFRGLATRCAPSSSSTCATSLNKGRPRGDLGQSRRRRDRLPDRRAASVVPLRLVRLLIRARDLLGSRR